MQNIYQSYKTKVLEVIHESVDTVRLRFAFVDRKVQKEFNFLPGQFVQIGITGWGECPISICSSLTESSKYFELSIRDVGSLTHRLNQLKKGDEVYVRGPFGNGFDIEQFKDNPLILIGGGCGFVPLRPLIVDYLSGIVKSQNLQIFYGCLNEKTLLFKKEYATWNRKSELNIILEKPSKKWAGETGLVTDLIRKRKISANSVAVLVGPPVMYKFVIAELKKKKVKEKNIFVSLEKKMYCGVGVCQHCAIGPYYVCKDGPVFRLSEIKKYLK